MANQHKGSQCCGTCYKLFKAGMVLVRKINSISPDTLFHIECTDREPENNTLDVYADKGITTKMLVLPEENFKKIA